MLQLEYLHMIYNNFFYHPFLQRNSFKGSLYLLQFYIIIHPFSNRRAQRYLLGKVLNILHRMDSHIIRTIQLLYWQNILIHSHNLLHRLLHHNFRHFLLNIQPFSIQRYLLRHIHQKRSIFYFWCLLFFHIFHLKSRIHRFDSFLGHKCHKRCIYHNLLNIYYILNNHQQGDTDHEDNLRFSTILYDQHE